MNLWEIDTDTFIMMGRAVFIYISALIMVRLTGKRLQKELTAFDFILGIILGSVLSRAINGSAPLIPTIGAGIAIVFTQWIFATLTFHFPWCSKWLEGEPRTLVDNGEILWKNMREAHISETELYSELRRSTKTENLQQVKEAKLEPSGSISFILKEKKD